MSKDVNTLSPEAENTTDSRRRVLKYMSGAGIAGATAKGLPESWISPTIDSALLPAHAQGTNCAVPCNFNILLSWGLDSSLSRGNVFDMDLEVITPGGTRIAPKSANGDGLEGNCVKHSGDQALTSVGIARNAQESVSPIGENVSPGRYQIYLRNSGTSSRSFSVHVENCEGGTMSIKQMTGISAGEVRSWGTVEVDENGQVELRQN